MAGSESGKWYVLMEWYVCGLLFQWTIEIQLSVLVQYKVQIFINSLNITGSCHDITKKIYSWRVKQQSLTHSYNSVITYV
jgi:hypothetical protein